MSFIKKYLLLLVCTLVICVTATATASPIAMRGIVEGFYGTEWTKAERLDMFDFMVDKELNTYIYAPKDDPYHRSKWREPYPADKSEELAELAAAARAKNLHFIYAISPGLDLGDDIKIEALEVVKKFHDLEKIGITEFAIFLDDIKEKDARKHADLINLVSYVYPNLVVVPTEYFLLQMKGYTREFAAAINADSLVLYTGKSVCPDGLTEEDILDFQAIYPRSRIGIWWNYPVNDYQPTKLALGAVDKMPKAVHRIEAFLMNPMSRAELSKIALSTGADFALDPAAYDQEKSLTEAIDRLYAKYGVAKEMQRFARSRTRLKNSWAMIGQEELELSAEENQKIIAKFKEKLPPKIVAEIVGEVIAGDAAKVNQLNAEQAK